MLMGYNIDLEKIMGNVLFVFYEFSNILGDYKSLFCGVMWIFGE